MDEHSTNQYKWIWILIIAAAASATYAALGHPSEYGFYILTRWTVTIASIATALLIAERNQGLAIAAGLCALIFNPIIPLNLGRNLWLVLDLGAAVLLVINGCVITKDQSTQE